LTESIPEGSLTGRSALVTGASRGIGLAVAFRLAREGVRLAVVARGEGALLRVAGETGAVAVRGDLASAAGAADVARRVEEAIGTPDILVNSAGGFLLAPIAETDPAEFQRQLDVNLAAPFHMMRAFLPGMLARRGGHIVTIGSVAGRVAMAGNGAYSASKFGLRGLHEVLAEEVRGTGVRATLVEPAATDTPLWDPFDPDGRADLPSRSSMLSPDDVARAVVFAVSQPAEVELSLLAVRSAR
jgi:NAD(P)-dependent dehydrogenase (short-subunit alcohol dehydrogenase family)